MFFFIFFRKKMRASDFISRSVVDVKQEIANMLEPNEVCYSEALSELFKTQKARFLYFKDHYMIPRINGPKRYNDDFLSALSDDEKSNIDICDFGMKYIVEKYLLIENFDPPRYGDYIEISEVKNIFFTSSKDDKSFYGFAQSGDIGFEFATMIPKEIILGMNLPFNYYQNFESYIAKIDIRNWKSNILEGILLSCNKSFDDDYSTFIEYLEQDIDYITIHQPVDSITEADSSLFTLKMIDETNINIRIGVSTIGWLNGMDTDPPPKESFINIINNNDQLYVNIVSFSHSEDSIYDYCIEIIPYDPN